MNGEYSSTEKTRSNISPDRRDQATSTSPKPLDSKLLKEHSVSFLQVNPLDTQFGAEEVLSEDITPPTYQYHPIISPVATRIVGREEYSIGPESPRYTQSELDSWELTLPSQQFNSPSSAKFTNPSSNRNYQNISFDKISTRSNSVHQKQLVHNKTLDGNDNGYHRNSVSCLPSSTDHRSLEVKPAHLYQTNIVFCISCGQFRYRDPKNWNCHI